MIALAALFGLSHGYENGRALAADGAAHLFVPGIALAGFTLAALVSAATLALTARAQWLRIGVRVAGSWIAAIDILMLGVSQTGSRATAIAPRWTGRWSAFR